MMTYLIIVALILLLPVVGILPIVLEGSRSVNNAYLVRIEKPSAKVWNVQSRAGVIAQEVCEWWLRWFGAVVLATPVAWVVRDLEVAPLLQVMALLIGTLWAAVFAKQFDLIGHTVEIVVAEREGREGYAVEEAARMNRGALDGGAGMGVGAILDAVDRRRRVAKLLLTLMAIRLKRVR